MTISRLFVLENSPGNTKAFIDFETNEGIILKGFKLVQGPTGLFVGAPSEKGKDGKWRESVIVPKELRDEINRAAVSEYNRLVMNNGAAPEPADSHNDLPF